MNSVYLSDIPRVITALAEWCACLTTYLLCAHNHTRRISGPRLWATLGVGLAVQCLFMQLTDELRIIFWLPCMMVAVALMFGLIAACCNMPLVSVGYCTVRAFLLAEFAASLEWQLYSYALYALGWQEEGVRKGVLSVLMLAGVYAAVFSLLEKIIYNHCSDTYASQS